MNNPKVSVIIPVYGVEKYIERCARSLFEQSLESVEFIFVDDCTKDNSINILENVLKDYPDRNKQIQILHHEINKGLPQARRTGMLAASGEYIINIDSDDWVDISMVERMYNKAFTENADMVICDICITDGNTSNIAKGCYSTIKENVIKDLCSFKIMWSIFNKLFKRSLLSDDMQFPICNNAEDMAYTIPLTLKCCKIAYEPLPLYYYYHNSNSMTHVIDEKSLFKLYNMYCENVNIVVHAFEKAELTAQYNKPLDVIKFRAKMLLYALLHSHKYYGIWKSTFPEINLRIFFNPYVPMMNKIKYLFAYIHLYPLKKYRIDVK